MSDETEHLTPMERARREEPRRYGFERKDAIGEIQEIQGAVPAKAPLLPPNDPHIDLEAFNHAQLLEEKSRILTLARDNLANLPDHDLGRLSRVHALIRKALGSGPPASAKRPSPAKRAAALPADLSDVPV